MSYHLVAISFPNLLNHSEKAQIIVTRFEKLKHYILNVILCQLFQLLIDGGAHFMGTHILNSLIQFFEWGLC